MGNQSSREQQKGTESLLSTWTSKQQSQLKEQYLRLINSSNEKQTEEIHLETIIKSTISTDTLAHAISLDTKPIRSELAEALAKYIAYHSSNNTKDSSSSSPTIASFAGFLKTAHDINHQDPTSFYTTYTLAYKQYQCSLEMFVLWLVQSAIPFWFEGSGILQSTDKQWNQQQKEGSSNEDPKGPERLMQYLVYREHKRKLRQKKREQEEMALWMDDADNIKSKEKAEAGVWHRQVTQTSTRLEESLISTWITQTPIVLVLFHLIVRRVCFGNPAHHKNEEEEEDTHHQDRIKGLLSPAIEKPTGNMFGKGEFSKILTPYDYFMLTRSLPSNARSWSSYEQSQRRVHHNLEHQLIFSSRRNGISWQVFVNRIVNQGATLLVIKTKDGSIFGGYTDEEWKPVTEWYGNSSNFLFRIRYPGDDKHNLGEQDQLVMDTWNGDLGSNTHYQYLCWGKQSLPNALAMGGQFDYAGLWLDADFLHGHSKAGPVCTTYKSPQLSLEENFKVDEIEVFLVRPMIREDDDMMEDKGGILSRTEDMEFMEMAGKKLYSRDLQEPDPRELDGNDEDVDDKN